MAKTKATKLAVAEKIPLGFPTEVTTRKNLRYVVVPVEAVRSLSQKRLQDQVRVSQMDDDLIKSLEELVAAAKLAKRGNLSEERELALPAVAW